MAKSREALEEIVLSHHTMEHWHRRRVEVERWAEGQKVARRPKSVKWLKHDYVDEELYSVLSVLNQCGISTEYSCAGVSVLDDPEDHSLYAYLTFYDTDVASSYVNYLMEKMKHRLMVIYEPARNRFDLSSFYIQHNRSFCLLLHYYTFQFFSDQKLSNKITVT
ncbi:hypothetical protein [Ammoniphilus sp. CFH 90114]|uniref:hypothetical protein n=1 Tax=Ammoniphilus sp. CFH 90114 TaxID=2493665 RepID=UPI00196AC70F|nr:hypothetical protein [Ammoniphilus sp. CFH 90114]